MHQFVQLALLVVASNKAENRLKKLVPGSPDYQHLEVNIKVMKACEELAWPINKTLTLVDIRKLATVIQDAGVTFPVAHQQAISRAQISAKLELGRINDWASGLWPWPGGPAICSAWGVAEGLPDGDWQPRGNVQRSMAIWSRLGELVMDGAIWQ